MDAQAVENLEKLGRLAHGDPGYMALLAQCRELEARFDRVISALPPEEQGLAWEFVMLTEARSTRKLELACSNMMFPAGETENKPGSE